MTSNQIAYWRNVETERANRAQEAETYRSHVASEKETRRHNLMQEHVNMGTLRETERHNLMYEQESKRHNIETELVERGRLSETQRHNKAAEDISYGQLSETQRHNIEQEIISGRSVDLGYAQLDENRRHNIQSEYLQGQNVQLGYAQLNEALRHNLVSEQQARYATDVSAATTLEKVRMDNLQSDINSKRSQETSLLGHRLNYASHIYSADASAAASRYSTDQKHLADMAEIGRKNSSDVRSQNESERHNREEERRKSNELYIYGTAKAAELEMDRARTVQQGAKTASDILGTIGRIYNIAQGKER